MEDKMNTRENLTVAQLEKLVAMRFQMTILRTERLSSRITKELGDPPSPKDDPTIVAAKNKINAHFCKLIAQRIKEKDDGAPLLSYQDLIPLESELLDTLSERYTDAKQRAQQRKLLKKVIRPMFENILEIGHGMMTATGRSPHQDYCRWVDTVLKLAAQHNMPPTEFLGLAEADDQITGRFFSRQEFNILDMGWFERTNNEEKIRKIFLEPMLAAAKDDAERREMEQEFETELLLPSRERFKKCKKIFRAWLAEEEARIYGAE